MPHATVPHTGFQALILCGPGEGLNPFNANPTDYPKALIPIANRPMVWYPLDWCYRAGITNITLITPPDCQPALSTALSQNPYLTSLPTPRPTLLAPSALSLTTGTAELLRLSEVQGAITNDFVVLPCDLVCELPGLKLLETWMTLQAPLDSGENEFEKNSRRGGLGVWYQTKDTQIEGSVGVKKEETDFVALAEGNHHATLPLRSNDLLSKTKELVLCMPSATLQDVAEESQNILQIRRAALRRHGAIKLLTTYRDAHIYFFPSWIKEFALRNESFESIGEDLLGWWAKAGWQEGLSEKLQIRESMKRKRRKSEVVEDKSIEDEIDISSLVSTNPVAYTSQRFRPATEDTQVFASRVKTTTSDSISSKVEAEKDGISNSSALDLCPKVLSYTHTTIPSSNSSSNSSTPSTEPLPLIRRIDTAPLLLTASLYLARLPPTAESNNPYSHASKIHPTTKQPDRATITGSTTLVDANCTLAEKITLKDAVIGPSCTIETMCRINRCVVMDWTTVGEKTTLTGCVVGRRAKIEAGCELKDCQISDGFVVPAGTVSKGEVFAGFDEADGSFAGNSDEGMDLDDNDDDVDF